MEWDKMEWDKNVVELKIVPTLQQAVDNMCIAKENDDVIEHINACMQAYEAETANAAHWESRRTDDNSDAISELIAKDEKSAETYLGDAKKSFKENKIITSFWGL